MGFEMASKARKVAGVTRSVKSLVDDDVSVRESLPELLRALRFAVRAFASALEFLASDCIDETDCLLLDVRMPGMSGPVLQQELRRLKREMPIVFITAPADEPLRSDLIEQGAIACLFKPFSNTALCEALDAAVRMN
jgi:FixJ family two-component response regulator